MAINDDDLDACFSTNDFGVEAFFTISVGDEVRVEGYFTGATEAVDLMGELEVNDASFTCRTSKVTSVKNGMTVTISGTVYEVKRKQNIGNGTTLIYLKT